MIIVAIAMVAWAVVAVIVIIGAIRSKARFDQKLRDDEYDLDS